MALTLGSVALQQISSLFKSVSCVNIFHLSTRRPYMSMFLKRNKIPVSFLIRNSISSNEVSIHNKDYQCLSAGNTGHTADRRCQDAVQHCRFAEVDSVGEMNNESHWLSSHKHATSEAGSNGHTEVSFSGKFKCVGQCDNHSCMTQNIRDISLLKEFVTRHKCPQKGSSTTQNTIFSYPALKSGKSVHKSRDFQPLRHFHSSPHEMVKESSIHTCKSNNSNLTSTQDISQEASQILGNPDWEIEVNNSILRSSGDESVDYVNNVMMPHIKEYINDKRLITENLIVLLLVRMAGYGKLLTVDKQQQNSLQNDILSLATIMMMIRLGLRVHHEVDQSNDTEEVQTSSIQVKLSVLLGDLIDVALYSAVSQLKIPEVVGIIFTAISDIITTAFRMSKPQSNTKDDSASSVVQAHLATDVAGETPFPWEHTPYDSQTNDQHSGKDQYFLKASECLDCFPESQDKMLMVRLARYYVDSGREE